MVEGELFRIIFTFSCLYLNWIYWTYMQCILDRLNEVYENIWFVFIFVVVKVFLFDEARTLGHVG